MKWKINVRENNIIETEFDLWQIYCENQSGHKLATIFLPQNVTEYVFTNLGRYWSESFPKNYVYVVFFFNYVFIFCS